MLQIFRWIQIIQLSSSFALQRQSDHVTTFSSQWRIPKTQNYQVLKPPTSPATTPLPPSWHQNGKQETTSPPLDFSARNLKPSCQTKGRIHAAPKPAGYPSLTEPTQWHSLSQVLYEGESRGRVNGRVCRGGVTRRLLASIYFRFPSLYLYWREAETGLTQVECFIPAYSVLVNMV